MHTTNREPRYRWIAAALEAALAGDEDQADEDDGDRGDDGDGATEAAGPER